MRSWLADLEKNNIFCVGHFHTLFQYAHINEAFWGLGLERKCVKQGVLVNCRVMRFIRVWFDLFLLVYLKQRNQNGPYAVVVQ